MKQQHQRPLAVGDLCTTRGSKFPVNDGLRVVVVEHVHGRRFGGQLRQYTIARIDGEPIPFVTHEDGTRGPAMSGMCGRGRLIRLDSGGEDRHDVLVRGRDPMEAVRAWDLAKKSVATLLDRIAQGAA